MKKIYTLFIELWDKTGFKKLFKSLKKLSLTEKLVFYFLLVILVISGTNMAWNYNRSLLVEIPTHGGFLKEGVIGIPRFINPVLAFSDVDRDLTGLIYSGLLRYDTNGNLINDLAENYTISEDGTIYHFTLKPDLKFQDGQPVTTDDIDFTIQKILDPGIKSPKMANWKGVEIHKINDREIEFSLSHPYPPFLSNFTIGILPKHLWKDLTVEDFTASNINLNNIKPVGSGPYEYKSISYNTSGIPSAYTLEAYNEFVLGEPFIKNLSIAFYSNEKKMLEAFKSGEIESFGGINPQNLSDLTKNKNITIKPIPLSQVFAFFINQNQNHIFTNLEVRQALNQSFDRDYAIQKSLAGYAKKLTTPIPSVFLPLNYYVNEESATTIDLEAIKKNLDKAGWKLNSGGILEKKISKTETQQFAFSITTLNSSELRAVAEVAKANWESIGAKVELKFFESGDLNQEIIRQRQYDILLYGEVVNRDLDLYGFWHSSQRNYPGYNLSLYANSKVDKILEDARRMEDNQNRINKYLDFEKEISKDIPAIFAYSKEYLYIAPNKVKGTIIKNMTVQTERFTNIYKWYTDTDHVWKIFAK